MLDDEDRENEGDLIINADKVTTEAMAFMVEHTSGVVSTSCSCSGFTRLLQHAVVYQTFSQPFNLAAKTVVGLNQLPADGVHSHPVLLLKEHDSAAVPSTLQQPLSADCCQ